MDTLNKIKHLSSSNSERTALVKKNIFGSFIIRGINILISFFLVPLTIGYVTNEIYGIWITIFSIVQWIGIFDIGFGNGLRNKLAESIAKNDVDTAQKYVSTTYVCLSLIFIPLAVLVFFVVPIINWPSLLNVSVQLNNDIVRSMQILTLFVCLTLIAKTQGTVLLAMQQNALSSMFDTFGQILVLITIFILTLTTNGSLTILAIVLSTCPLFATFIGTWWVYRIKYPKLKPTLSTIKFSFAKDILNLGVQFFIIQIATLVLYGAINVLISNVANPIEVTEYNVVYKYLSIPYMIFGIIISPLWSAYTDAFTKKDYKWMVKNYNKMFKTMFSMISLLILLVAIYSLFFKLWLGAKVVIHFSMVLVVAIYIFINIWSTLHANIINGLGKIKLQLIASCLMTIINIPLALFLGHKWGAIGVILSSCILSFFPMLLFTVQVRKILYNTAKGVWNK